MGVISRGVKNAFRNTIRTISITFILGLSVAMALIMLLSLKTVQSKIDSVKSSIGNTITVSPAGVRGFEGGGELLADQNATDIAAISHISKVTKTLSDRLRNSSDSLPNNFPGANNNNSNNTTDLISPITAGSFGQRQQRQQSNTNVEPERTFAMPVTVSGTNDITSLASLGVSQFTLTGGANIDANSSDNIAMVGKDLASKNNLSIDSTFKAYGKDIKVVGIFDTGNTFTNGAVVMPVKALQVLSDQAGQYNSLIIQTDSIDSMAGVTQSIKDRLGDKADVVSAQDTSQSAIAPLENIKTISLYSMIGSLVAGAVIIFLIMIMIVRERRREIGVLKAIGSSNIKIVSQFTVEAMVLTLLSSVLGVILGIIFSNPVLKVLVNNSQSATTATRGADQMFRGGGQMMERIGGGLGGAQNTLQNIHTVIGLDIILYGLGAAILIAIIGSAVPSFFIAKVRPAEVMRAE